MFIARIDGTVTSTVKHASLAGARLLIGQRLGADGREVGEPLVLVDPIGARPGTLVIVTTDGDHARRLLGSQQTPVRLSVLGIVEQVSTEAPSRA